MQTEKRHRVLAAVRSRLVGSSKVRMWSFCIRIHTGNLGLVASERLFEDRICRNIGVGAKPST